MKGFTPSFFRLFVAAFAFAALVSGALLAVGIPSPRAEVFDVNGDDELGLAEAVYILQVVAGVRVDTFAPVLYTLEAPAPVINTGQTTIWASGDDGDLGLGVPLPSPRYTDLGDGTVEDHLTGLIWLKDADALGRVTFASALAKVALLNSGTDFSATDYVPGTYDDWRLPNFIELLSVRDMNYFDPPISNAAKNAQWSEGDPFVDIQEDYYWSSTTMGDNPDGAYYLNMQDGRTGRQIKSGSNMVWAVRDGPNMATAPARLRTTGQVAKYSDGDDGDLQKGVPVLDPAADPPRTARFTDNGDGTVTDHLTGLMWLKDAEAIGAQYWPQAFQQIAAFNNGTDFSAEDYTPGTFDDWRFPNLNEMQSLMDLEYFAPPISNEDKTAKWVTTHPFVDINKNKTTGAYGYYWTSTTVSGNAEAKWYVIWQDGTVGRADKDTRKYIWPVRFAQ